MGKFRYAGTTGLYEQDGAYFYRSQLSAVQYPNLGLREIRRSLRTSDARLARLRCVCADLLIKNLIEKVEAMYAETTPYVLEMAQKYFKSELEAIFDLVAYGPSDPGVSIVAEAEYALASMKLYREMAVDQKFNQSINYEICDSYKAAERQMPPPHSDVYKEVGVCLSRARAEAQRIYRAYLTGEFDQTEIRDPLFKTVNSVEQVNHDKLEYISLNEAVVRYMAHHQNSLIGTKKDYARVLGWLNEWMGGERAFNDIALIDVRSFRDMLAKMPVNFSKITMNKGRGLVDVINSKGAADHRKIGVATQKKYFSLAKAFFQWAVDEGYSTVSPAQNLKVSVNKKSAVGQTRLPFDETDLHLILTSPLYTGYKSQTSWSKAGKVRTVLPEFWFLLIGLLSGMRLSEIVQLRLVDIVDKNGLLCFSVNTGDGDKGVKSQAGIRLVPVHHQLLEIGLMDWAASSAKNKLENRIFPTFISKNKKDNGSIVSKRIGRYLRAIGIGDKRKCFHSFRHSFIDALRNGEVPHYTIHKLVGHAGKDVTSGYGVGTSLSVMKSAVDGCYENVDFEHLKAMK